MATKISQIVVSLEGKSVDVNGESYTVRQGALFTKDEEKVTPRKIGTTWSEILELSGTTISKDEVKPASAADIVEEVKNTKVEVPETPTPKVESVDKPKQVAKPKQESSSDATLEYYTTPGQKEALAPIYQNTDNEVAKLILSNWEDQMDRATVVKVNRDQVLELDKVFKAALENGVQIPSRTLKSIQNKHVALTK